MNYYVKEHKLAKVFRLKKLTTKAAQITIVNTINAHFIQHKKRTQMKLIKYLKNLSSGLERMYSEKK